MDSFTTFTSLLPISINLEESPLIASGPSIALPVNMEEEGSSDAVAFCVITFLAHFALPFLSVLVVPNAAELPINYCGRFDSRPPSLYLSP
ncbi:hypothetical protein BT96DRAFT_1010611 [Gymnopus androsaceus JB14]|uniref:Uncharacterized protein n=1 Tax=Gymnopus androsaceus JB14 TaxID=1447944 RepID=A0A6A4GAG9_9AGAR|nr:hypothetical protein BT96DRAFT_1010611 [Gymnopus androsaceus JB14]